MNRTLLLPMNFRGPQRYVFLGIFLLFAILFWFLVGGKLQVEKPGECLGDFKTLPYLSQIWISMFLPLDQDKKCIKFDSSITGIWIDVGANQMQHTSDALGLGNIFVIAFEPIMDLWYPLFSNKHPRKAVLPVAVGSEPGYATFHQTQNKHSSSLKPFDKAGLEEWEGLWKGIGGDLSVKKEFQVPVLPLDQLFSLLPVRIEYLKIDAQGMDLEVIAAAKDTLSLVDRILMEVSLTKNPLYTGQPSKSDAVSFLAKKGFILEKEELSADSPAGDRLEANLWFKRSLPEK